MQARLADPETPESLLVTEEIRATVNRAIEALPEDLRTAIVLRELEGLSYEDIAAAMDCPVGTGAFADLPRARGDRPEIVGCVRRRPGPRRGVGMNEQEQISQLSALFDGELPAQQAELVIRRAVKDSAMREHWQRYALIGACLRGEPLAGADRRDGLAERVRARLAAEADIIAPGALAAGRSAGGRGGFAGFFSRNAAGGAIAAAVAILSIVVVRSIGPVATGASPLVADNTQVEAVSPAVGAADGTAAAQGETAPRSYTTPGENSPVTKRLVNQQPLAHYVVAHSEQAASALGFSYDLTQGRRGSD